MVLKYGEMGIVFINDRKETGYIRKCHEKNAIKIDIYKFSSLENVQKHFMYH